MSVPETEPQVAETTHAGLRSRRLKPVWWLAIVALFAASLWAWSELRVRTARAEIEELRAANQALQQNTQRLRAQNERSVATLRLLSSGATRTLNLAGQRNTPTASARIYYDPVQQKALAFFYSLPATPGGKSYQLWVTRTDRPEPQSAAVFEVGDRGEAELSLENLPAAGAMRSLALTLEPRGGSPTPTGPRYLAGRAQ